MFVQGQIMLPSGNRSSKSNTHVKAWRLLGVVALFVLLSLCIDCTAAAFLQMADAELLWQ